MDQYQQEIEELTDLMRTEWSDLRECVEAAGIDPSSTLLASFIESEDEEEFCVLVTSNRKIYSCSRSTSEDPPLAFSTVEELPINENTFSLSPCIELAIKKQDNA